MIKLVTERMTGNSKTSAAFKCGLVIYIVALIIYPYIFIIHYFFPGTYSFGVEKSAAVALITLALIFAFLLQAKAIIVKLGSRDFIIYLFCFSSLLVTRFLVYPEKITFLLQYRIFIFPLIYAGLANHYLACQGIKALGQKIILVQTIIQAIFGIFLWNFVYTGKITHHLLKLWEGGGRMGGTLMSSNLFPAFLLIGAFILISPYLKIRFPHWIKIILLLILALAVVYSNSRWPFFISILILFLSFKDVFRAPKNYFAKIIITIIIVAVLVISSIFLPNALEQTAGRAINDQPNFRLAKYELGLNNVLDNAFFGFFIGATREKMGSRIMIYLEEGLKFSDNSYILMMEFLGILITCLYILIFISIIRKTSVISGNRLLLFYLAGSLFFNSAISWDLWLIFFFAALYALQPDKQEKNQTMKFVRC